MYIGVVQPRYLQQKAVGAMKLSVQRILRLIIENYLPLAMLNAG